MLSSRPVFSSILISLSFLILSPSLGSSVSVLLCPTPTLAPRPLTYLILLVCIQVSERNSYVPVMIDSNRKNAVSALKEFLFWSLRGYSASNNRNVKVACDEHHKRLEQRLTNYSHKVFIKLLEAHPCPFISGLFMAVFAELYDCDKDCMAPKAKDIY